MSGKLDERFINASQTPQANQIPVLNSSGQLSLPFTQVPILVNGQDMMSRTFYVDAENGDDNNDGSESAPFKTIQKACDSVPVGGFGKIYLNSDYEGVFEAHCKKFWILIDSGKVWTIPMGNMCYISGSQITICNRGQIIIDKGDESNIIADNYAGFWVHNYETNNYLAVTTNLYLVNLEATNAIRIDSSRALFGSRTYGSNQNIQMNLAIYNLYCDGDFIIDGNLLVLHNGCGCFQWNNYGNDSSFAVVDSSGNSVDVKDKIAGIIKDANGVPRNIISNIVF